MRWIWIGIMALAGCGTCEPGFLDGDGDGFGGTTEACLGEPGVVARGTDCDDTNASVHPGAAEVCNTVEPRDDDCDGRVDGDDPDLEGGILGYPDRDSDGFGAGNEPQRACDLSELALTNDDCDDNDPIVHPEATEGLASVDLDCDGWVQRFLFQDFDGAFDPELFDEVTTGVPPNGDSAAARLQPGERLVLPVVLDGCETPRLTARVRRDADVPGTRDTLTISLGGTVAVQQDAGADDAGFRDLEAPLPWAPGTVAGAQALVIELEGAEGPETVWVDDLELRCTGDDPDGDGWGRTRDCTSEDPRHWSDCGRCTDADGDGFGDDCNLGPDCNDADVTVSPGAPDARFDGVDDDCDLEDGPASVETFEAGALDPAAWPDVAGVTLVADQPLDGDWSLAMPGPAVLT